MVQVPFNFSEQINVTSYLFFFSPKVTCKGNGFGNKIRSSNGWFRKDVFMACLNFFIMIDLGIFVFELYFFIYLKGRYMRQRLRKRE